MADIRIKDLTTTASSTASDDFIAVDGATNGTRKLSAFSPTFGGNATVTGTLTVNNPVVAQGTTITGYQFLAKDTGGTAVGAAYALQTSGGTDKWRWGLRGSAGSLTDSLIFSYLSGSWSDALTLSNAGVVSIPATTASTSTSTGALVVGNGTSGGLGVGGQITAGGNIVSQGTAILIGNGTDNSATLYATGGPVKFFANASEAGRFATAGNLLLGTTTDSGGKLQINKSNGGNTTGAANAAISLPTDESTIQGPGAYTQIRMGGNLVLGSSNETLIQVNQVNAIKITSSQQVQVPTTTASTSTSTGALVVSGGVGVAGAIYAGGNIVNTGVLSATSSATTLTNVLSNTLTAATNVLNLQLRRGDSANGFARLMLNTSTTTEWSFGTRAADTNLYVWDEVANAARLTVASSDGLATFGAAIRTSAPSGGTAANWKLGTVATVSPTSPNRTIEVDIGGTIYYIHAKTTNN